MNKRAAMAAARRVRDVRRSVQVDRMRKLGYLTVADAADAAGISIPRVYQLLAGELKGTREGARRYVEIRSLREMFPRAVLR